MAATCSNKKFQTKIDLFTLPFCQEKIIKNIVQVYELESVFSPNAGKRGKNVDPNNSEYGHFLHIDRYSLVQNKTSMHLVTCNEQRLSLRFLSSATLATNPKGFYSEAFFSSTKVLVRSYYEKFCDYYH